MMSPAIIKHITIPAFYIVILSLFFFAGIAVAESAGDFEVSSGSVGPDYTYESPINSRFSPDEGPDRQYEKIIIRSILREQANLAGPQEAIEQKPDASNTLFTIYGFNIIPETAVSTMILIGGVLIFRYRRRG